MPLYTFKCFTDGCDHEEEVLCKFEERLDPQSLCPLHECALTWKGVETPQLDFNGNKSGRFQMKAITQHGDKIPGHFGRSARKK